MAWAGAERSGRRRPGELTAVDHDARKGDPPAGALVGRSNRWWSVGLFMAVVVLGTALLGIATRPAGFFAAFWPANPLLVGVLVRWPVLNRPAAWVGAFAGYMLADLIAGSSLALTALLTAGNLIGVACATAVLVRLPEDDRLLRQPRGVLWVLVAAVAGGAGGALTVPVVAPSVLSTSLHLSTAGWFAAELANYLTLLPVVLSAPDLALVRLRRGGPARELWQRLSASPLPWLVAGLTLAVALAVIVDGPGAIVFTLPVLLVGAFSGRVFRTAVLVLISNAAILLAVSRGLLTAGVLHGGIVDGRLSLQVGLAVVSLGPLMVAASARVQGRELRTLQGLVTYDSLTGVLSRQAFLDAAASRLEHARGAGQRVAVLMLDIDRFKQINDRHGHHGGDLVLQRFAQAVRSGLRETDLLGRIGGEEFAAVVFGVPPEHVVDQAERIRSDVAGLEVDTPSGPVRLTVSIGIAHAETGGADLSRLLEVADQAMYRAKSLGRDTVVESAPGE